MTDQLTNAIASGGAMSVIFAFAIYFLWRWWNNEVKRVRSTGERIISKKDEIIERKDEMLIEQAKDYEVKLTQLAERYDSRIGSIVKTYDAKIKEKDDQLTSFREEMQTVLINDATQKTKLTNSINNLINAINKG
jgi:K+ transporter